MTKEHATKRNYKDTLFRMLFSDKEELLSLYNAVRGTNYTNPEELEINTLEDVIYMSMKNDISFVIGGSISIYEHQSTWSSNLPLRNLIYIANLYAGITANKNLYGSKVIALPNPQFVVFYNGKKELPDCSVQKLSEAYEVKDDVNLELMIVTLNINKGHNQELMDKCKTLREYSYYVDAVRRFSKTMSIHDAVEKAIATCIDNDVLAELLRTHRVEVMNVSIFEYDAERHIAQEKAESREEGKIVQLISLICSKILKSKSIETIAEELECEVEEIRELYEIIQECGVEYDADKIAEKYFL